MPFYRQTRLSQKRKSRLKIRMERAKAESARTTVKLLDDMNRKKNQMMQEKEKSYQEHIKQLTQKMDIDRAKMKKENERIIALKLQEQERLLREGFQNESRRLHNEIENLRTRMKRGKKTCAIS